MSLTEKEPALYSELIPAQDAKSRRLMIMLHGLGDSMEGFRWLPEALGFPWLNYLLVNAPDSYYGGYSWYDFMGNMAPGVERSSRLLFQLLDAQRAKGFPSEQTILGGFSQGCLMSIETGLRYRHKLAGIVGISGYVCDPGKLIREISGEAKEVPILVTHGLFDPMIPFTVVRQQIQSLQDAGLKIDWHEFPKAHNIAGEQELEVIRGFIGNCYGAKNQNDQ